MLKIYYNNSTDYNNKNRFKDKIEGNNNVAYNPFLSSTSIDLYYKTNDRSETINFQTADFIPLAVNDIGLRPSNFTIIKVDSNIVTLTYNNNNTLRVTNN
jgi:hypothetical protein